MTVYLNESSVFSSIYYYHEQQYLVFLNTNLLLLVSAIRGPPESPTQMTPTP